MPDAMGIQERKCPLEWAKVFRKNSKKKPMRREEAHYPIEMCTLGFVFGLEIRVYGIENRVTI